MVMTRNQTKEIAAAREGPRTRSKVATLQRYTAEEMEVANILVEMKNSTMQFTIERSSNDGASANQLRERPRRTCANY